MADKKKRLVRELQELRGIPYQSALNELNELRPDVSWRAYIDRVREQRETAGDRLSREPK